MRCPECGSYNTRWRGWQYQKEGKKKRNRGCNDCSNRWFPEDLVEIAPSNSPKILVLDIETLPIWARVWSLKVGRYISPSNIIEGKDWCLLSYAAKWLGDNRIMSGVLTPKQAIARDDSQLTEDLWNMLDQAEIVIAYNGERFDLPKINARFLYYKKPPTRRYRILDPIRTLRSKFGMTSNRLGFVNAFLGLDEKISTDYELWVGCDNGNQEALSQMETYNVQDIDSLEQLYFELRPWIYNHPNIAIYAGEEEGCPYCGSISVHRDGGWHYTNTTKYPTYRCGSCFGTFPQRLAEPGEIKPLFKA